ncbi:helix-turn-helix domain-containing protein [Geodermatophilus sp. SYSU D00814]
MDTGRAQVSHRAAPPGRLGRVRNAGRIEGGRGIPLPGLRRFDGYALMLVFGGGGRYRDREHDLLLVPGDLVEVLPGRPHWYGCTGPGRWDEVHLVFEGPVFDLCLQQGLLGAGRPVHRLAPVEWWLSRLDGFRTRRPPLGAAGVDDEVCDVLRLLAELAARRSGPAADGGPGGWLARSRARLAADLSEPLALADVAAEVGLGYESWRKRFQAETGVPPARYRAQRRIEAAAELLRRTSLGNREIAASLGFSDEHHLARRFRAATGRTTGAFRRESGG